MVTSEDRMKILQMLQDGKITPDAAAQLLDAMGEGKVETRTPAVAVSQGELVEPGRKPRWLRVRVTDSNSGRPRVNVRLPISLVNLGLKLGARYSPEMEGLDMAALMQAVQEGDTGLVVDVTDEEDGEHVEVFLE